MLRAQRLVLLCLSEIPQVGLNNRQTDSETDACQTIDPCIDAERRMSLEQRILHQRQLGSDPAIPELRSFQSHTISHGSTEMQR